MRLARIGFDRVLGALAQPVEPFLAHPELRRAALAALRRRAGANGSLGCPSSC